MNYYIGPGGNDNNPGTSWVQRKLTVSGIEAIPIAAGDTVYIGSGSAAPDTHIEYAEVNSCPDKDNAESEGE